MSQEGRAKLGRILLFLGRIALAVIFLAAAYGKLKPLGNMHWSVASAKTSLAMFAMQVDSYQMLSQSGVNFVAFYLPPFELLLGLWLLSGITLRFSSLITTLLFGGLFGVVARAYILRLPINCGCFGPSEQLTIWTVIRDGSMLAVSLAVTVGAFLVARKRIPAEVPVGTPTPQRAD